VPQQSLAGDGRHRIVVANDLGMHCADLDSRVVSILPPYNVLHAQVIATGTKPTLLDESPGLGRPMSMFSSRCAAR
jgi:hypothetical protein